MASITQPVPTDGSVGIFTNAFDSAGQATISTWKASWSQGAQPWPQAITLYIPFSATEGKRAVNEKDLSAAFGPPGPTEPSTPFQVYVGNSEKAELQPSNEQIIVLNGSTLFAPVAPQSTTALSWFVEKLQAIVSEPPDTKSEAPDGQENPTNLVSQGTGTMSASGTQRATVSENGISTSGSSTPSCKVDVTSTPKFQGSVAGGIGGGILVGLIIGFLVWSCCYRRPRTRSSRYHLDSSTAVEPHLQPRHAAFAKETQIFEVPKSVVGWQKHLPQEKDDATVVRAVKALYDQIQIHIEGFYHAKQGKVGSQDTAILERYLSDSLPDSLSELPSDLSLLEGILVRRIVHRISLWSSTRQSLLPSECTKVPKRNEWHMETDDDNQVHTAESKKGFPQAFTQWRILTSFLTPTPAENSEYQKQLETKVDYAARPLSEAFAPWSLDGKNAADRDASLRSIMLMASDVGLLIFAQPSTFVFDWSSKEGSVIISPAFIKRLDESARPLRSPQVMIDARQLAI